MTCYLWAVIERDTLAILRWEVTTDSHPTHDTTREVWARVSTFKL